MPSHLQAWPVGWTGSLGAGLMGRNPGHATVWDGYVSVHFLEWRAGKAIGTAGSHAGVWVCKCVCASGKGVRVQG